MKIKHELPKPYRKIAPHITTREAECKCGCGLINLAPEIIYLFEEVRREVGCPINISSASRCLKHQKRLVSVNSFAADISPHVEAYAIDTKPIIGLDMRCFPAIIDTCAKRLGFPYPRIGSRLYEFKFYHWDLVFLKFQPYTITPNPRPDIWVPKRRW